MIAVDTENYFKQIVRIVYSPSISENSPQKYEENQSALTLSQEDQNHFEISSRQNQMT